MRVQPLFTEEEAKMLQDKYYRPILDEDDYLCAFLKYIEAGGEPPDEDES